MCNPSLISTFTNNNILHFTYNISHPNNIIPAFYHIFSTLKKKLQLLEQYLSYMRHFHNPKPILNAVMKHQPMEHTLTQRVYWRQRHRWNFHSVGEQLFAVNIISTLTLWQYININNLVFITITFKIVIILST